jgi:hypothetical protein
VGLWSIFALSLLDATQASGEKVPEAMIAKRCMNCHKEYKGMRDIVAGDVYSRSGKAKTIQVKIEEGMQLVKYSDETEVVNVPDIKSLKAPIPVRIHYKTVGDDLVATKIVAKPKMKVPEDQLISTEELVQLVQKGPEKGRYTLVDSRPGIRYQEGHIPTAISIPFPKMAEMKDKLPKDKNQLLIFYCGGFR